MLAVGEILMDRYRIIREIGAGGMGTVYEGENLRIRRRVAIKVMRATDEPSAELLARFEREAQIASQIPSDHITEVLDLGELSNGQSFIVMEYLAGESLAARLDRAGRLHPNQAVPLVRQVLEALSAAHRVGVVHRDIKPDNVFILEKPGQPDFVKLLDFGVSKVRRPENEVRLTQTGAVVGTPLFMSPEQVGGGEATPLSDLYATGVILYRALTGDAPFKALQLNELVYKIALGRFAPPSSRAVEVDPWLDAIVCQAMALAPEQRFQSADEFIAAIDSWLADRGLGIDGRTPTSGQLPASGGRIPTPGSTTVPSPITHLNTEVLNAESVRRGSRKRVWIGMAAGAAVLAALAAWGIGMSSSSETAPDVGVFAAQPVPAAPVSDTPAPAPVQVTPASSAAPSSPAERTGGSAAAAAPAEASPRAAARDLADGEATPRAREAEGPKAERGTTPRRRPTNGKSKRASSAASHEPAESAPAQPAEENERRRDSRPDWGY